MQDRANRKERLTPLNEDARHTDTRVTLGPLETQGFERRLRRPRVAGFDEPIELDRADEIEGIFYDGSDYDVY